MAIAHLSKRRRNKILNLVIGRKRQLIHNFKYVSLKLVSLNYLIVTNKLVEGLTRFYHLRIYHATKSLFKTNFAYIDMGRFL